MERLTERFSNGQAAVLGCGENCKYDFKYCKTYSENCPTMTQIYEKLANYEDVEEQGKLLKLPCKPGDTVYMIEDDCEFNGDCHQTRTCKTCEYRNVLIEEDIATLKFIVENIDKFGKTVFLTEQEAKEALERMERE